MSVIPILQRLRQEDCEFEASLSYFVSEWNFERRVSGSAEESLPTVCTSSTSRKQNKRTLWKTVWYLPNSRTMAANP